ncbi:hypothetical protein FQN49_000276 [Arthroderma sp. PD_2]|nr:hypothetical protein FQN49_000276 [Arthroderma sp. PD_2]
MANEVKNYFLAPSWDYRPDGPISIGNIVRGPKKLTPALYSHPYHYTETRIYKSFKEDFEWSYDKSMGVSLGIWAQFLKFLGFAVDMEVKSNNFNQKILQFERIDTEEIFPDDDFIRKAMATPAVASYLENSRYKKSLYMVVGVKKVTGAAARTIAGKERSHKLEIGRDGTLTGVPASLGPKTGIETSALDTTSFAKSSDFVFAFRLRKVKIRRNNQVEQEDYNRGALLADHVDKTPDAPGFTCMGLEGEDALPEEFGLEKPVLVGDDRECVYVSMIK